MTVAAIVVAGSADEALADAAGRPAVRRIAELAWAGGATPIVVVSPDPTGSVAAALAGSEAVRATGGDPAAASVAEGARTAMGLVAATGAVLVWPARLTWVGAETVTTLIEAHGRTPDAVLRPSWRGVAGWPALVPADALDAAAAADLDTVIPLLIVAGRSILDLDLGDPGAVQGTETALDALPPYEGPAGPLAPPPDWGAAGADLADEAG